MDIYVAVVDSKGSTIMERQYVNKTDGVALENLKSSKTYYLLIGGYSSQYATIKIEKD